MSYKNFRKIIHYSLFSRSRLTFSKMQSQKRGWLTSCFLFLTSCFLLLTSYFPLLTFHSSLAYAQAPDTLWTKRYGGAQFDAGISVQEIIGGGYIICGYTKSFGAGGADVYLIKTDSSGDSLWTKTYGGVYDDVGWWVEQTSDTGYIIAGETKSFSHGPSDMWLIKTNAKGDTLWTKTYGGAGNDYARSVQTTAEGGYIICGASSSFNLGRDLDVYLVKTNDQGDILWQKTYGGTDEDGGLSIQQTLDKGYIIAGETKSFGTGGWDVYLIKTDSLGDTLWTKVYGKAYDDKAYSVRQTVFGGYIICGYTQLSDAGDWNVWLIKTDADGDTSWLQSIGGAGDDAGGGVQQTADGGYIIAGYSNSFETPNDAIYIIKTDSLGNILWTKIIGGTISTDRAMSLKVVSGGGYIITGYTITISASGDVYLIRLGSEPGIEEETTRPITVYHYGSTILSGPLVLPAGKNCKVYDITGRTVDANRLAPGVYFIEIDGNITNKVIKVK